MSADTCLLCEARGAKFRPGRLGRYAHTCDECEQRRGTHLSTAAASLVLSALIR